MASLETTIPHQLSQQEAIARIKNLLSETKKERGDQIKDLKETWNGNVGDFSFTVQHYDISGTITVNPTNIDVDATVPFAVSLFKGVIIKTLNEKAAELLK